MNTKPLPAVIALASLLAAGCAGVPKVLPPEARAAIRETDVRCYLPQNEVNLQYMRSGYGSGGGLIGALVDAGIDSAMASKAEERAARIREAVRGHDFRGLYWRSVSNAVIEIPWLNTCTFEGVPSDIAPVTREAVAEHALLNLGTDYAITPDHRVFRVDTSLQVYIPGKHKKPAAANGVCYQSARIGDEEGDKAAALWIADDGAAYIKAATEGIEQTVSLLRHALAIMGSEGGAEGRAAKIKADFVHGRGGFGIPTGRTTLKGRILEETPDRVIFHADAGSLFSLPRGEVEIKYLKK